MFTLDLRPFGWNCPEFSIQIDLSPLSTRSLRRAHEGQKLPLNQAASWNRQI